MAFNILNLNFTVLCCGHLSEVFHLFDAVSGRELGDSQPLTHHSNITTLSLSQAGPASESLLAFIDKNNDLHVSSVHGHCKALSLGKSGYLMVSGCKDACMYVCGVSFCGYMLYMWLIRDVNISKSLSYISWPLSEYSIPFQVPW